MVKDTASGQGTQEPVVFIVDDDDSVRRALARLVRWAGHQAETFNSGTAFLASGRLQDPGCVLLDLCMPGMGGLEVSTRLADLGSAISVIYMSAYEEELARLQLQPGRAGAFLRKPFDDQDVMAAVQAALATAEDG